jgi:WD40 repeat protein
MSTPVSAAREHDAFPVRPSPLVVRTFGEPRFHADADIAAVAFAPDNTVLAVDEAGVLRRWAADGKQLARYFLSDLETLWCFGPGAKLLASGNDDLIIWDAATGTLLNRVEQPGGESAWISALAFDPTGALVATGHDDGTVRFWNVPAQQFAGELKAHPRAGVSAVSFSPDGLWVATAGEDLSVRVWDAVTHKPVAELKSHTDRIPALAWSPHSKLLISAGWDMSARVWRPPHPDPLMLLNSHADQVIAVASSPDGKYLACADSDNDIHLWHDAEAATRGPVLKGHNDEIKALAFSADGTKLASAGADRVVHIWDVRDGKLIAGPNPRGKHAVALILGAPLRVASSAGTKVRVWDAETGDEVAPTNLCAAYSVAASPDGKWLAVGGSDHYTQLWNAVEGGVSASLEATKPPVGALAFTPDSKTVIHTSPADGLVWLWTCATGEPQVILIEAADACTLEALAVHPNGQWVACAGIDYMGTGERDGATVIWDVPTKQKRSVIPTGATALAFDPQGKYLAAAGLDDAVYVWEIEQEGDDPPVVFVFGGHNQNINAVAFDPTGSYLLSAGDDGTVRCWDVLSGRQLSARQFDAPVQSLAVSPDGRYVFLGNSNTTVYQVELKAFVEE